MKASSNYQSAEKITELSQVNFTVDFVEEGTKTLKSLIFYELGKERKGSKSIEYLIEPAK